MKSLAWHAPAGTGFTRNRGTVTNGSRGRWTHARVLPCRLYDTPAAACFTRVCRLAGIKNATLHTLRHTFASIAGELGFTELTIRAMLGHASQNVTQDYIHIDEALKLAVRRTSVEIARLLDEGAAGLRRPAPAA